jgi:hypothetical protein
VSPREPRPPAAEQIEAGARRSQATIGAIGLALVIAFSAYLLFNGHPSGPGVAAGSPVREFVAPLASSDLNVSANVHPRCDPAHPARRGLNVCGRSAIVLDLFVTDAGECVRSVDALETVSKRFHGIEFAAVALDASKLTAQSQALVHHWRIPIAYDSDGAVAALYGVSVCPLIELADSHGRIVGRLIGKAWNDPARLASEVRRLLAPG